MIENYNQKAGDLEDLFKTKAPGVEWRIKRTYDFEGPTPDWFVVQSRSHINGRTYAVEQRLESVSDEFLKGFVDQKIEDCLFALTRCLKA